MESDPVKPRMRVAVIIALLLPILVLGGMTFKAVADLKTGERWQIKIAGYDPRHILQGRYLTYQYVWNLASKTQSETQSDALCPVEGGACCACLQTGADGRKDPRVSFHACTDEALPRCEGMIRGHDEWGGFSFGKNQYFIPERHAAALEKILQDGKHQAYMEISIPRPGHAVLADLLIDGKSWRAFLDTQKPSPDPEQ